MKRGFLTTEYESQINRVLCGEKIIFNCEYDLTNNDKYTEGIFIVTKKSIAVFENGEIKVLASLKNIQKICVGELIGCGILEAFINEERKMLARFSMRHIEAFSAAAEVINSLINGETVGEIEFEEEEKICPKCGGTFIHGTKVCRKCTSRFSMIKRLWQLSKSCKGIYAFLVIFFLVASVINILTPHLKKNLVNDVLTVKNASKEALLGVVLFMFVLGVITYLLNVLRDIASSKASNLLVKNLRGAIYEKLQRMPLGYIEEKNAGDLMQRINNDTQRIQSFIQDIFILAVGEVIMAVAIGIITFSINYVMALLIFVPIPPSIYMIYKIRLSIGRRYRKQWRVMDVLTSRLTDVLNGINVVKVFGREDDETKRFKDTARNVRNLTCKNEKYVYTIFPIIKFIMGFGSYFVLLYGGSKVIDGSLSVGELVQFSAYGSYLYSKLEWFSMVPRHFTMAMASSSRVFEILDAPEPEEKEIISDIENINGEFEFDNVSFGYKSYRRVLRGINESVKKGEMIGLVGHSGAGKSTLINLIMKLYSPNKGKIMLDGKNLDSYSDKDYKSTLGIVLQENYLFSGTILDNIAYAVPNATYEDIILAAKKASAHDFIVNLPDGYNTYVGEKGHRLSGGERQRISIARAIAANPKIIILDEATASVDTETEIKIQEALLNVTRNKTVFAIAHRLSTLKNADRLFVLDEGRVKEKGTHKELEESGGIYSSLLRAQQDMVKSKITIDNISLKEF